MEDIIIGVYKNSSGNAAVLYNSETEEMFYHDDQDVAYAIFGFALETPPVTDVNIDINTELDEMPDGVIAVVYDGKNKWVLTEDYTAYKVPAEATDIAGYTEVADFTDDTEYEPLDGDDE